MLNYLLGAMDNPDGFLKSVPIEICQYLIKNFPELVEQETMNLAIKNAPVLVQELSSQFQITYTPNGKPA